MESPAAVTADPGTRSKVLLASSVGTFVEYYDLGVYALLATTIAALFFPSDNPTASLLATLAVFAVAFVMRPVGGLFFGHYGDKIGRRNTLAAAILLMTAGTFCIGLLPSHASIGVLAPILLVLCRLLQGFSTGGEFSGATSFIYEYAPQDRRGLYAYPLEAASALAFLGAVAIVLPLSSILSEEALNSWGWRIPFLLAGPFGLIGLYVRLKIEETPAFRIIDRAQAIEQAPLLEAIRTQYKRILLFFCPAAVNAIAFYTLTSYMATYLTVNLGYSQTNALLINGVALVAFCVAGFILARLSDSVGRRPVMLGALAAVTVLTIPSFFLMTQGAKIAVIGLIIYAISFCGIAFMNPILAAELYPTRVRYSSNALGYNVAYMLFGGTAPYVSAFLTDRLGSDFAPAFYATIAAVIALVIVFFGLPETYRRPVLDEEERPMKRGETAAETAE